MDVTSELIRRVAQLEKWRERQETLEPRRTWLFSQTADVTVANTAAETTLVGSGVGSLSLPANFFVPGRVMRVTAGGDMGWTATPTIALRLYCGTSNVGGHGVMTLAATPVTARFWYQNTFICRTVGATGAVAVLTRVDYVKDIANGIVQVPLGYGSSTVTIDTTISLTLNFKVQWGTANAANTITCGYLLVEALN